jgi:hypothetical protein
MIFVYKISSSPKGVGVGTAICNFGSSALGSGSTTLLKKLFELFEDRANDTLGRYVPYVL